MTSVGAGILCILVALVDEMNAVYKEEGHHCSFFMLYVNKSCSLKCKLNASRYHALFCFVFGWNIEHCSWQKCCLTWPADGLNVEHYSLMYIVLPDLCGRRHWILMWRSISLEWYGMVEIGEHEFIKMQFLFLWISRWKRLAKYVQLETCTFNFLILSPLTNEIHNINILTHFRFGQSCIAFILFV